jgi:hypothetical protein
MAGAMNSKRSIMPSCDPRITRAVKEDSKLPASNAAPSQATREKVIDYPHCR